MSGENLFEKVSFVVHKGDRLGLVGPNGSGKSTLLKAVVGQVELDKDPRQILGSFLFSDHSVFKKVSSLSLGERVRLIFAKLTNQNNELLVLDEPTNHLDIQSREIIENALMEYQGAIIVVSHDRYYIEKINDSRSLSIKNGILVK